MKNIIILSKDNKVEAWESLTMLCRNHKELKCSYLKSKKFPFESKGWKFIKVRYNPMT